MAFSVTFNGFNVCLYTPRARIEFGIDDKLPFTQEPEVTKLVVKESNGPEAEVRLVATRSTCEISSTGDPGNVLFWFDMSRSDVESLDRCLDKIREWTEAYSRGDCLCPSGTARCECMCEERRE